MFDVLAFGMPGMWEWLVILALFGCFIVLPAIILIVFLYLVTRKKQNPPPQE